jgi:hypothetical protein
VTRLTQNLASPTGLNPCYRLEKKNYDKEIQ